MTTVSETLGRSGRWFGRKLGNCQSGIIVWWHVTSGNGIAELGNRPLKQRLRGGKDAADEEKLNRPGGGGAP